MSYFLRNKRWLDERYTGAGPRFWGSPATRNHITVVPSESGTPTIIAGGRTLHSRTDPIAEARDLAATVPAGHDTLVVVAGMGLGYHVNACRHALPVAQPICVVEPDHGVFLAAIDYCDLVPWSDEEGSRHLGFVITDDPLAAVAECRRAMIRTGCVRVTLLEHPPTIRRFGHWWDSIRRWCAAPHAVPKENAVYVRDDGAGHSVRRLMSAFRDVLGMRAA